MKSVHLTIVKRFGFAIALYCSQASVAYGQCSMVLEDKHNYEVVTGGALGILGALVPGGALVTGLAAVATTSVSDAANRSKEANKSEREIALRDFLDKVRPQPDPAELQKFGFVVASVNSNMNGCQIRVTAQQTRLIGGRYGGDVIAQNFDVVKYVDGEIVDRQSVNVEPVVSLLLFQPEPNKRWKHDSRTGKYVNVTKPMLEPDIYNQKVADLYSKVVVLNASRATKKAKIQN